MKKLLLPLLAFLLAVAAPALADTTITAPAPHILTLATGAPHPQALVQSLDLVNGIMLFAWLDSSGNLVDSGHSIARFTPVVTTPASGATPAVYGAPADSVLIAAIAALY